jgi:glycosyltransferase involved in cell wall biosynthesis
LNICIIVPFYNEADHLKKSIESFIDQSYPLDKIILVDDHSTDNSLQIAKKYESNTIKIVQTDARSERKPGKKVINAFNVGLKEIDINQYDLLGKFDADILLPDHYFEQMVNAFKKDHQLGICSGLLYIRYNNKWIYEAIADENKIRGPLKLYRVDCFKQIDGLRNGIGWDSVDQYLANYYQWTTSVLKQIKVKHLKPTGSGYSNQHAFEFGKSMYVMRYGLFISSLAISKLAFAKKSISFLIMAGKGYWFACNKKVDKIVTSEEGKFIRQYRLKAMKKRFLN